MNVNKCQLRLMIFDINEQFEYKMKENRTDAHLL